MKNMEQQNNSEKQKKNSYEIYSFEQIKLPSHKTQLYTSLPHIKWGDDNLFPQFLIDSYNRSSIHNSIVTSKAQQISSVDIEFEDSKTKDFFDSVNKYGESFYDIFQKMVIDYILFGGSDVLLKLQRGGTYSIYHMPMEKNRMDKSMESVWVSDDWERYRLGVNIPHSYPLFEKGVVEGVYRIREYHPGSYHYPTPSYVGALEAIVCDAEMSNFWLSMLLNGFNAGHIINFNNGIPDSEEKRRDIEKRVIKKFTSTDKADLIAVSFNNNKDSAMTIDTVPQNGLDKKFILLKETIIEDILWGHKITSPTLVGIKTPGQLGGTNEIEQAYRLYDSTVIQPIKKVFEKHINKILSINGMGSIKLQTVAPIDFTFSESILKEIMSVNELREKIGLSPQNEE